MKKVLFVSAMVLILAGLMSTGAFAIAPRYSINISDLTEGVPSVQVLDPTGADVTSSLVTILDSVDEYLHFNLAWVDTPTPSFAYYYANIYEGVIGGILSDRLLVHTTSAAADGIDVKFASDPQTINLTSLSPLFQLDSVIENGEYQAIMTIGGTSIGINYFDTFYVRSDAKTPEPTTILLYGLGFAGAGLYRRMRRKVKQ